MPITVCSGSRSPNSYNMGVAIHYFVGDCCDPEVQSNISSGFINIINGSHHEVISNMCSLYEGECRCVIYDFCTMPMHIPVILHSNVHVRTCTCTSLTYTRTKFCLLWCLNTCMYMYCSSIWHSSPYSTDFRHEAEDIVLCTGNC